ncbi:ACT domain-containing protein [Sedimenticola thiotaurini]|uniref:Acetyltransferase n=1 Tax=Sedimenticola thiotaurini TaxID=1543721 RepID=A0A0F7JYT7_9GAMM|nr:ACT domain-containing protein [Sedimenticola thiotaurini]AKH20479.1 acetyltransferase [Sedimenticola thiotaurini]
MQPISDLGRLLQAMEPVQTPGVYIFTMLPDGVAIDPASIVASIREPEGVSLVVTEETAVHLELPVLFRAAWITLNVHSDLAAVGLTAAFSTALGEVGISCNVVAGVHHDHIFVPYEQANSALTALRRLQHSAN